MIFLGDIACPEQKLQDLKTAINNEEFFKNEIVVYNLEGNIVPENEVTSEGLHNTPHVVQLFNNAKKVIVSVANNHTYDYPNHILNTKKILDDSNIGSFGLNNDTYSPYEYFDEESGEMYAFFGHCWRLYTNTNTNKINDIRIMDLDYEEFCGIVDDYIQKHGNSKVICFMHWNYDMEILPFPMLRSVSRKLIDLGVEAVIGSHSHVPQGTEIYKGKLIAYCLGNCYIPSGYFFDGKLMYPDDSKIGYAIKLDLNNYQYEIKWFHTDENNDNPFYFENNNELCKNKMDALSPFEKMNDLEYKKHFKHYRKKKMLVPVYFNYKGLFHKFEEFFGISRINIIKKLKLG